MPIQPTYPGVYVQEVSSGVRPITGVATSIAAFFCRTLKGPINKAVRCLSHSDFLREFAGGHAASEIGASVKQYFDNGGTDCYVVRLAHNARKADITLKSLAGANVLQVIAKDAGAWGNNVRLAVDYNTINPDESFNLHVSQEEGGVIVRNETFLNLSMNPASPRYAPTFISQSSRIVDAQLLPTFSIESSPLTGYSKGRRIIAAATHPDIRDRLNELVYPASPGSPVSSFDISVDGSPFVAIDMRATNPAAFAATTKTALEGEIAARINPRLPASLSVSVSLEEIDPGLYVLRVSSNTARQLGVTIRRATANDLAGPMMLGLDQGGVEVARYSNHRPVPTATYFSGSPNDLAKLLQSNVDTLTFGGAPAPNVINLNSPVPNLLRTTAAADRWFKDALATALTNHSDGVREKLQLIARNINDKPDAPVTAEVWGGYRIAFKPKTGMLNASYPLTSTTTDIGPRFTANVRQYALGNIGTGSHQNGAGAVGRDDDGTSLTVADYTGSALDHTGFNALDRVDLFTLMVIPQDGDIDEG